MLYQRVTGQDPRLCAQCGHGHWHKGRRHDCPGFLLLWTSLLSKGWGRCILSLKSGYN